LADLNVLLSLTQQNREAYLDRAQVFEMTYRPTLAVADFDEILRLDPGDIDALRRRANTYMRLGDFQHAQIDFNAVIERRANVPDGYLKRAVFYLGQGEPDLAIADCSQAIQLEPNRGSHRAARADAYRQRGDWKLAIDDLLYAVHGEPGRALFRSQLAAAREYQGDWLVALIDRDEAIRLEPANPNWRVNRAWTMMNLGRTEEALAGFADAIKLDPVAPQRYSARGFAQLRLGHYDDAAADFKKSIEVNPARASSYVDLANVSIYRGEPLAGLSQLELVHENAPDFEVDDNRGFLRLAAGQIDEAVADYSAYIIKRPDEASGFGGRGLAEFMKQGYRAAFDDLSRYAALRPLNSMAMIMLDLTRTRLGLPAPTGSAAFSHRFDPRKWPAPIFRFANGEIKVDALIKAAADPSAWRTRIQEAQAFLIAGEYDLAANRKQEARRMFTEVIARQLPAEWSTLIARTELARLNPAIDTPQSAANNSQQVGNQ
jgi:tetratricopeptide (TPR) repeat protein